MRLSNRSPLPASGVSLAATLPAAALLAVAGILLPTPARAQHVHAAEHATAEGVELAAQQTAPGVVTLRLGPLHLPARSDHHTVAQAPDRFWEIPFDGWILSYEPRLVGGEGEPVQGSLLHHVAFWNTGRSDFLCTNKEEHIFGAGGEMNEWIELPGVGYGVSKGDRIRVNTMFHNPTAEEYPEVYLEVRVSYEEESAGGAGAERSARQNVYPTWLDVQGCGESGYELTPGTNLTTGEMEIPVPGRLLGVGGHLHRYGKELVLVDLSEPVVTAAEHASDPAGHQLAHLVPQTDEAGRILSMPIVPFLMTGGYALEAGDVLRVTARYENPTGEEIPEGAMGIVVGYFLPEEDAEMARFERERSP